MTYLNSELAFSDVLPIAEPRPKPREVGLTGVRTPAQGLDYISDYVEMLGDYLDSVKWTVGTQRLVTREKVRAVNPLLAEHNIGVSSGGLLESVLPHGEKAVRAFLTSRETSDSRSSRSRPAMSSCPCRTSAQ